MAPGSLLGSGVGGAVVGGAVGRGAGVLGGSVGWVDGAVAGSWRYEGGGIELEPFEPLPRRVREEVEAEARRLAAFQAD